jgi:hypothetical protein
MTSHPLRRQRIPVPERERQRRRWLRPGRGTRVLALVALAACAPTTQPAGTLGSHPFQVLAARGSVQDGSLHILHPYLAARLQLLESRSPRLQNEMNAIRQGHLPVVLATSGPLSEISHGVALRERMPDFRLGEFRVVHHPGRREVAALVIRVNLQQIVERQQRWLRSQASRHPSRPDAMTEFEAAVDAILIHEIWGHLIPVVLAGSPHARCPDPLPGQADLASCVLQRENELRQEIGLQPRTRYKFSRYARP